MALNENPPCDNLRMQTPPHLISNPSTSQKLYWWHDLSGVTGSSTVPPTCCLDSEKCNSALAVKATIATDGCTKRISRIRRRYSGKQTTKRRAPFEESAAGGEKEESSRKQDRWEVFHRRAGDETPWSWVSTPHFEIWSAHRLVLYGAGIRNKPV